MMFCFTKMQALANDFVVVDATQQPFLLNAEQIRRMADRRLGVGFDQLLVIELARSNQADFYYRIFNADGAEVGQCGNGARCVALYIARQGLSQQATILLQTMAVTMRCELLANGGVSVQMPAPKFDRVDIPFDLSQPAMTDIEFGVVNVGNPHAVIVVDDVDDDEVDLAQWGRLLAQDNRFPAGVNVSVMAIDATNRIQLRVFERGVGETQACGSAACAAVAWGRQQGLLGDRVVVLQPGGELEVSWQGSDSPIEMLGFAELIFRGEYFLL